MRAIELKKIYINFASLASIKLFDYVLPLLILPVLIARIGMDGMGLIAQATAWSSLFRILLEYGFHLSATHKVALEADNPVALGVVVSRVHFTKLFLFFVSLVILSFLVMIVYRDDELLKQLIIFICLAGMLTSMAPRFFFLGIEKNHLFARYVLGSKFLFYILVISYIQDSNDMALYGVFQCVGSILLLYFTFRDVNLRKVRIVWIPFNEILGVLRDDLTIFLSHFVIGFNSSLRILVFSAFYSHGLIGAFSIAEKLVNAVNGVISIFSQAVFPQLSRIEKIDRAQYLTFKIKAICVIVGIGTLLVFAALFGGELLVRYLTKSMRSETVIYLQLLAFTFITFPMISLLTKTAVIESNKSTVFKAFIMSFLTNGIVMLVFGSISIYSPIGAIFVSQFVTLLVLGFRNMWPAIPCRPQ